MFLGNNLTQCLCTRQCTRKRNVVVIGTVIVGIIVLIVVIQTIGRYYRQLPIQDLLPLLRKATVIGTDVSLTKLINSGESSEYLLIVPRGSTKVQSLVNSDLIGTTDKFTITRLLRNLEKQRVYDGATCMGTFSNSPIPSSCYFERKNWTLLIRKTKTSPAFQEANVTECNIVEHAFVMRREVFETLGFNPQYGGSTLLDFFLRSKGQLKIVGVSDCSFSSELNRRDRGRLVNSPFFTDYIDLGTRHGIVRIIREKEITWTKCSYQDRVCPEKPLDNNITSSRKLFPVCCGEVLDKVLVDVVQALQTVGLDYRIEYGTLLGAVRSGTIIPWTRDVDVGLKEGDYFDKNNVNQLKQLLQLKNYSFPFYSNQRRVIPLFPPTRQFRQSLFSPSFQRQLFSLPMIEILKELANAKPYLFKWPERWRDLGYLDLYYVNNEQFISSTTIQINGRNYSTFVGIEEKLQAWYGHNYLSPYRNKWASEHNYKHEKSNYNIYMLYALCVVLLLILVIYKFVRRRLWSVSK